MSAIKMFVTIRSLPHVEKRFFHDHWRHPHGTWGRGIANITSYIQCHRIDTPFIDAGQQSLDGIVEVGFENAHDISGLSSDPAYLNYLRPDEPNFVENTGLGFMREEVLQSGQHTEAGWPWRESKQPISVKLIQVVKGQNATFLRHEDESELSESVNALRHVLAIPDAGLHPLPDDNTITFIRQLWWPTVSDFEQGVSSNPEAWHRLQSCGQGGYTGLFQAERFI
ncbi:hypothetical protein NG99_03775 [Erwinia typographi]|uniref:EthD domain-containing protein n=1 Tax=Erwinia typographi TaxID=371042 RepID=A0A0A3ZCV0_9GAMM|nr:EthD domain-containing protein [Erwinia typographi]KGT95461.1 hypothetical protein NG99_03775 [Erwinia typographi]